MAIDTSVPRSRRALLAGGIGGLAVLVASAVGRPLPASAADGDTVKVGGKYFGTKVTQITETVGNIAIYGESNWGGIGLLGRSDSDAGVVGQSYSGQGIRGFNHATNQPAVLALSINHSTGLLGCSGGTEPPAAPRKTGVYGYAAQDASAVGVRGVSGSGDGVVGSTGGVSKSGVYGVNSAGTGYGVFGRNSATQSTGYLGGDGIGVMGDALNVGVYGRSKANTGIFGWSQSGTGVSGWTGGSHKAAVFGSRDKYGTGVYGYSSATAAAEPPAPFLTGVYGYADDTGSCGVAGQTTYGYGVNGIATAGRGVFGEASTGTGVRGYAASGTAGYFSTAGPKSGTAVRVIGRVRFDNCSGITTIAIGTNNVTVTPGIDLTSTSAVVATLQGSAGRTTTVHRVTVNPRADTFAIYLTANATQNVKVAWHVFG